MTNEVVLARIEAGRPLMTDSKRRGYAISVGGICALGILLVPYVSSNYLLTLAIEVMIAGVFASGLNLLIGYTGLASAGHAMFYGLGGYGIGIGTAIYGFPRRSSAWQ